MNKNIEKEYKVLLTKNQYDCLCEVLPESYSRVQINTYYDTKQQDIRKCRGAMRIREVNGTFIFTLKMPSADGLLEFEKEVSANSILAFEDTEIKALLASYRLYGPWQKLATLTTRRRVSETADAEICLDESSYVGIVDHEIEYEYKKAHDGAAVFQKLLSIVDLTYTENCKAKIERVMDTLCR